MEMHEFETSRSSDSYSAQDQSFPTVFFLHREHYLSASQLSRFHQTLCTWRKQLEVEYADLGLRIRNQEERSGDIIDQSVNNHERMMEFISRERKLHTIMQIDAALKRIVDGSYGYCQVTGEEIGFDRLRAYPIATLSLIAQEQMERRQQVKN